jgi:hypothetical protein
MANARWMSQDCSKLSSDESGIRQLKTGSFPERNSPAAVRKVPAAEEMLSLL